MDTFFNSFSTGKAYAHAFRILLRSFNSSKITLNKQDFSLCIPLLSMGGFACELFLKYLANQDYKTHKLYSVLYKGLNKEWQDNIESFCIDAMKSKKSMQEYDHDQFTNDFLTVDKIFEEFRYVHEAPKEMGMKVYSIDFLEVLVCILEGLCTAKHEESINIPII